MKYIGHEQWCDWHFEQYPHECNCGETGTRNPPALYVRQPNGPRDRQSRVDSFMEVVCNTAIGLAVSQLANMTVLPWILGAPVSHGQALWLGVIYTAISLVRSYAIRRAFNGRTVWASVKAVFA